MEVRNLWILPLNTYTDEVLKLSYLKILTESKFETIKLPTYLAQYRYQHLMTPTNVLYVELIKTKKNWILKNILETKKILETDSYVDYLKFAEVVNIVLKYFQVDMETSLLKVFIEIFNSSPDIQNIDTKQVEEKINICLGFK
jgi:hypothetical protein